MSGRERGSVRGESMQVRGERVCASERVSGSVIGERECVCVRRERVCVCVRRESASERGRVSGRERGSV